MLEGFRRTAGRYDDPDGSVALLPDGLPANVMPPRPRATVKKANRPPSRAGSKQAARSKPKAKAAKAKPRAAGGKR